MKYEKNALTPSKRKRIFRENLYLFSLTVPGLVLMCVFSFFPMVLEKTLPFKKFVPRLGVFGSEWVGLQNFKVFFGGVNAWRLIRNTFLYGCWFLFSSVVIAAAVAILFYWLKSRQVGNIYRTIVQLPRFLTVIVLSYITFAFLSPQYGLINQWITEAGGEAIKWYSEPKYWPFIICFMRSWSAVGVQCLLFYATLLGIDEELFDAASLDGATAWQKTRHIAFPVLKSVMAFNLIMGVGALVSVDFGLFDALPRAQGLLYPTTDVIGTYIYRGTLSGDLTGPAAIGLLQNVIQVVLVVGANAVIKKIDPESSMF